MQYRDAAVADSPVLAEMNHQLIQDEGHSNPMSVAELEDRMRGWLQGDYKAIIFSDEQGSIGYALWRPEPEGVYLRQFLVHRDRRRQGLGRTAMDWFWPTRGETLRTSDWMSLPAMPEPFRSGEQSVALITASRWYDLALATGRLRPPPTEAVGEVRLLVLGRGQEAFHRS